MKKQVALCWSLIAGLSLLTSCSSGTIRPTEELASSTTAGAEYTAKPGDTLMVKVWGESQLSGEVYVREDGRFTLPLIEDVPAERKNLKQITEDVTKRLQEFVPAASVTISVVQAAPVRYYLSGQFVKPGEYRSDGRITLLQAIATGGGFAPFADESSIILIRRGASGEMRYELDYNRVVEGKDPNPELSDGDTIAVK